MGQILHGSASTTAVIRRTIQRSKLTNKALSQKYGINPKTVSKWRKRNYINDTPMGPKQPRSTILSKKEEAIMCIAFRKHTLLPLDDCLYSLQDTISHLTRSSLHRLFHRHDISRLPHLDSKKPAKKKFNTN